MKPLLHSIKGRMLSLEPTFNGYKMELISDGGRYVDLFIHSDGMTRFFSSFGKLKPNREVKIKCCKDYDIYGREVLQIENITPIKKEEQNEHNEGNA